MNNRIIKFRAWAVASRAMFYPESDGGWELYNGVLTPLLNTVLMQFTGLKDKNNKEIYEGDIIRDSEVTYEVRFGDFTLGDAEIVGFYCYNDKYGEGVIGKIDEEVIEVIGNIYTNPDLIQK